MTKTINTAAMNGLKFFGQMSASISHELKNTLSIINESTGLLEDLSILAEKGKPLDIKRVQQLSASVKRQVNRTDTIIRNMNRFSHLADDPVKQIEVMDFLRLVTDICRRFTDNAGITVILKEHEKPLNIITRPFYLHHLLWLLIQSCIKAASGINHLTLSPCPANDGIHIIFSNSQGIAELSDQLFQGEPEQILLSLLAATLVPGQKGNAPEEIVRLFVPGTMDL